MGKIFVFCDQAEILYLVT